MSEYQLLQEYVVCLQRENQAKNTERQTLYNQIQRLNLEFRLLQGYLDQAKVKAQKLQDSELKRKINDLQQQITILKYEQDQLFQENLSIVNQLETSHSKSIQLEKQNKQLRCQKQQLQKFRITLQKISRSLQSLEKERSSLAQTNYLLFQQNSYLKALVDDTHQRQIFEQTMPKSNYLMMRSFQKISQYDQQYQESHDGSSNKIKLFKQQNSSSLTKQNSFRQNKKIDDLNNSSYLMMDEKSRQSLNFSTDKIHEQGQKQDSIVPITLQKNILKNPQGPEQSRFFFKNNQQFSCDVVQQMYDEISHELDKRNTSDFESTIKFEKLRASNLELQQRLQISEQSFRKSVQERQFLHNRISQMERSEQYNIHLMQQKIEELLNNYNIIQQENRDKFYELERMAQYIERLQNNNQKLCNRINQYENLKDQNKRLKTKARSQNNDFKNQNQIVESNDYEQNESWERIDKTDLIKQNNGLIQKITELQKQKTSLYQQLCQSNYLRNDENQEPNEQFQDRKQVRKSLFYEQNLNNQNSGRLSNSEYRKLNAKEQFSLQCSKINDRLGKYSSDQQTINSPKDHNRRIKNGLKKRIALIKEQNEKLLRELEIN